MPKLIVCVGLAHTGPRAMADVGKYLLWFDPDAHGGLGEARWTSDRAEALRFADMGAALDCWKRQSRVKPIRADGAPNRPMTAYSITFEDDDDARQT